MTVSLLAVPAQASDPSAFVFSFEGAAGDWLVLNVPLATPVDEMRDMRAFTVTATAPDDEGGNLLVFPLDLLGDFESFPGDPFDPPMHHSVGPGETVTVTDAGNWTSGTSGVFLSFALAVAADVPWTLELSIDPAQGYPALGVPQVNAGTGTSVRTADELLGTPVAPADEVHLEGTFESAGWHHVQFEFDYVQPDGVRTYDVRLPTESWAGTGTITGYNTALMGSASSGGMIDMMGAFQDTAGDFSIDLTYVQASWDVEVFVYEMPGGFTLPDAWSSGYAENEWPFWDCLACPPLPDL